MPRQQTLSSAAHSVCVRGRKCMAWRHGQRAPPVCMSFCCVCMKELVKQTVLVSVWRNHHLLQAGESRPIDNLPSLMQTPQRARTCTVIGCEDFLPIDLQHGQRGPSPSPVKLRRGHVTSISVSRCHASNSSANGQQQQKSTAPEHANMLMHKPLPLFPNVHLNNHVTFSLVHLKTKSLVSSQNVTAMPVLQVSCNARKTNRSERYYMYIHERQTLGSLRSIRLTNRQMQTKHFVIPSKHNTLHQLFVHHAKSNDQ